MRGVCGSRSASPALGTLLHTGLEVHPASYPIGKGAVSPGLQWPLNVAHYSPPHTAEVKISWSSTSIHPMRFMSHNKNFAFVLHLIYSSRYRIYTISFKDWVASCAEVLLYCSWQWIHSRYCNTEVDEHGWRTWNKDVAFVRQLMFLYGVSFITNI